MFRHFRAALLLSPPKMSACSTMQCKCPTPFPAGLVHFCKTLRSSCRIAPLNGYVVRSMIWFQGEADAADEEKTPDYYECRLSALIPQWQSVLGNNTTPFNIVNLGAVNDTGANFGAVRMAQVCVVETGTPLWGEGCAQLDHRRVCRRAGIRSLGVPVVSHGSRV